MPSGRNRVSSFLNIGVGDIAAVYADWTSRGAEFLHPPIDRGVEIRCYMRDPDRHLIEVGHLMADPDQPIHIAIPGDSSPEGDPE